MHRVLFNKFIATWKKNPLFVGTCIGTTIVGIGDVLLQTNIERKDPFTIRGLVDHIQNSQEELLPEGVKQASSKVERREDKGSSHGKNFVYSLVHFISPLNFAQLLFPFLSIEKEEEIKKARRLQNSWSYQSLFDDVFDDVFKDFDQKSNRPKKKIDYNRFDYSRFLRFIITGFCFLGPSLGLWYGKFYPKFIGWKPLSSLSLFQKNILYTAMDQTFFISYWISVFLFTHTFYQYQSFPRAFDTVRDNVFSIVSERWNLWPLLIMCSVSFVHPMCRTIYFNVWNIIWNGILIKYGSWNNYLETQKEVFGRDVKTIKS